MPKYEITRFFSNSGTRKEVRDRVIEAFQAETPGTGRGEYASKYIYFVETLSSGARVYLQRPANRYNGFDFIVCVENANYALPGNKCRNFPKHTELCIDLQKKKEENGEMYTRLYTLLKRIFDCEDVHDDEMEAIHFNTGLPVDHILKVIKWLFIEQDIRYWNYSGRFMIWGLVPSVE